MRDRTADLNTASVALSQLSYSPEADAYYHHLIRFSQTLFNNFFKKLFAAVDTA